MAVWLSSTDLRRKVVRGANRRRRQVQGVGEPFRDPKVANFDQLLGSDKNVPSLRVLVENVLLAQVCSAVLLGITPPRHLRPEDEG